WFWYRGLACSGGGGFSGTGWGRCLSTTPASSCLPEGVRGYLERSAAANAMIGVAHDPSRTSPHARNDPLGPSVAIGDESGARRRGLPSAACGRGISVTCRRRCPRERSRGCGESNYVASPFDVGFSNFEFDGLELSSTPTRLCCLFTPGLAD